MANDQNTTGFATTCPAHLEIWRKNAARAEADDRFTVLWNALVDAYAKTLVLSTYDHDEATREQAHYDDGVYEGLRLAYALVTGDTEDVVHEQVARTGAVPVPS